MISLQLHVVFFPINLQSEQQLKATVTPAEAVLSVNIKSKGQLHNYVHVCTAEM